LVQKSFARLIYNDLITCPEAVMKMIGKDNFQNIEKFRNYSNEVSLVDKDLERTFTAGTVLFLDHRKSSGFCETANFRFEVGTGSPVLGPDDCLK